MKGFLCFTLGWVGFAALPASATAQNPRILIVQARKADENSPFSVDNYFAQELEEQGKAIPIVWSLSDPIFRAAVSDGSLGTVPDRPGFNEAVSAAGRLRAEYVAILQVALKGGQLSGKINIYRQDREVFKDEQNVSVKLGDTLKENDSAKTIARTWAGKISSTIFKGIPTKPKIEAPEIGPAQVTAIEVPVAPPVDNRTVIARAAEINKETDREISQLRQNLTKALFDPADLESRIATLIAGRDQEIIAWYRDAVDAEPLDFERRKLLIESIMVVDPAEAAREARRTARLITDHPELRIMAARAWLRVPNEAEAQTDLNEAISRDPDAIAVRLLLAEIGLSKLEADRALEHADRAVKKESNPETRFMRAVCRALLGGADGVKADMAELAKTGTTAEQYALAMRVLDRALDESISSLKSLTQKGIVKKTDEAVRDGMEQLQRTLASRILLMDTLTIPATKRALFDHLLLAHKLLAQSVIDLRGFLNAEGEDSLNESRINLGEAIRHLTESRGQLQKMG